MGFFDKFLGKGQPEKEAPKPVDDLPRTELAAAAGHLAADRKAEAVAIYESLIAAQPDSGALLAAISSDLGRHGFLEELIHTIGPAYDAAIHGPEAGLNLIQAHLRLGQPEGAQMWIDVLTALDRPELADRLFGFAHAAAELRDAETVEVPSQNTQPQNEESVNLVSVSKPLWSYVLPDAGALLPVKEGGLRSIALVPLGAADADGNALDPDHAANVWVRAFPFAVAEALYFAPTWKPKAVVALVQGKQLFTPPRGFGLEQVRGLFRGGKDASDYAVTGFLRVATDRLDVKLEVIDVRKDRSMKVLTESGAIDRADEVFSNIFTQLRQYLEAAKPVPGSLEYKAPAALTAHFVALDHAVAFFLVDKTVVPPEFLGDAAARADALDALAAAASDPIAPLLARGARTILGRLPSS